MKKIFIDPGHGGIDPGAVGNELMEKDVNLAVALRMRTLLNELYVGHEILMSRTTDVTRTLEQRTNAANHWMADFLVSIHCNAGGGRGFESFIYNPTFTGKSRTKRMRNQLHDAIVNETGFIDRGKKEQNFHMVRASNMPACLTENGFIDRIEDARLLKDAAFIERIARGHAIGIGKALQLRSNSAMNEERLYRVIAGSFIRREYADIQLVILKQKGIDSFILPVVVNEQTYYRVVTGTFSEQSNAMSMRRALQESGFDSFILSV